MKNDLRAGCVIAAVFLTSIACDAVEKDLGAVVHEHESLSDQECGVCGMSVGMQPAPRAQVLHRDGTRLLFCSIGDWQVHLSAPSPHGKVMASFVEVIEPGEDPMILDTREHSWIPAQEATYVVGVPRSGIMGKPVLAYRAPAEAESVSASHRGAEVMDHEKLKSWWGAVPD
jgi:copper chaperone NosL